MTHGEAVKRLMELADGRYCVVAYETKCLYRQPRVCITAYIEDVGHTEAKTTYAAAIENMEIKLGIASGPTDAPPEDTAL